MINGEPFFFRQVLSAVRNKDASKIINQSRIWLAALKTGVDVRTLTEFTREYGTETLNDSLTVLMESCFGKANRGLADSSWDPSSFTRELTKARDRACRRHSSIRQKLPFLNPNSANSIVGAK